MKKTECIIVGCGIAGITVAWELFKRNISFVIIGNTKLSACSLIAPGVFNPIVFKRITPSWQASVLIEQLKDFYQYVENKLHQHLLLPLEIWHVLSNTNEVNLWKEKQELYPKFLNDTNTFSSPHLNNPLKCGVVTNAGRLKVAEYLYYSIEFFKSLNCFSEQTFHYPNLVLHTDFFEYENIIGSHIIFCEGYQVKNNPWFNFIQLKPAKGEVLHIETQNAVLPENTVLHQHISIIPIEKNKYILGSNYEWNELNETPTEQVKQHFLSVFENIFNVSYEMVGHYAGIRPAADRRPIIGYHPEIKNMFVFNGLGTKGVMIAPYAAKILADNILHHTPIPDDLSVNRFLK